MQLRPYQEDAADAVLDAFRAGERAVLAVLPTGTGKTVLFAAIASTFADSKQKTLVLAHRGELLDQAAGTLGNFGLRVAVEKAAEKANPHSLFDEVVIASVQSMRGDRLARWPKDAFGLIVCDEAHHFLAPTFKAILDHFPAAKVLGVTATPERGDGGRLGEVFPHLAIEYPMRDAINDGWLCRLRIERPATTVNLAAIRTTAGDLNQGDLEDEISQHIEELVNSTKERIDDRPALVFTPDVGSAEAFAEGLRQVGVTARSVSGLSPDRTATIKGFQAGDFQVCANCQLLTEGFDSPHVAAVVLARPTKSGVLYRQMVGRGTRPFAGKTNCLILDFAWNSGRHNLVSPVELFDTSRLDVEVRQIADGLIRDGKQADPLKAIEQAERIHRHRLAVRVQVRERASKYRFLAFDPFEVGQLLGVPRRPMAHGATPLTRLQGMRLAGLKIDATGLGRSQADRLLAEIDRRQAADLATHRQVAALVANGVDQDVAVALPFAAASRQLDLLFSGRREAR